MKNSAFDIWPTKTTANLMAIFSVLAVVLALGTRPISSLDLFLVLLLVSSYTWLFVFLFARLRPLGQVNFFIVSFGLLVAVLILGATRGWLFSNANLWFGIYDPASLEQRVLNSTISTLVWAVAIIAVEFRLRRYRSAFREKLMKKASQLGASELTNRDSEIAFPGVEDLSKLQQNLRLIASELKGQDKSVSALPIAAREIQSQVTELLRPLSHRIWFNAEKNRPQFHLSGLLAQALRTLRINWWLTVTVGTGIFFLGSLSLLSFQESLIRTLGYTGFLSVALILLARVSWRPKNPVVGGVVLGAIATGTSLVSEFVASALIYGQSTTSYPIVAIAGPLSTLALLFLATVLGQLDQDWKLMGSMLDGSEFAVGDAATDIRFASFLHNSLQSELNGIALTLSNIPDPNAPEVAKLLGRLEQISNESITQRYIESQARDFGYLQELIEAWEPLIAIDLKTPTEVSEHPRFALFTELLEESISNAVRHAAAKEMSVEVTLGKDEIFVIISHPAPKEHAELKQLGAGWLEGYAKSHQLERQKGRRTLKVAL